MDNRSALTRVLASLVYRVTAHGIARLVHIANPALTFVANFPPCLQSEHIPSYPHDVSTQELLGYLPHTGTIGEMLAFYFAFSFSKPYVPLIPPGPNGEDRELYFGDNPDDPCNVALRRFRREMKAFMGDANVGQWPRNIET